MIDLPWKETTADWKKDRVEELVKAGFSFSQIAAEIGAPSRNAISTIACNLRTAGRLPTQKKRVPAPVVPKQGRPAKETGAWGSVVGKVKTKLSRPSLDAANIATRVEGRTEAAGLPVTISRAAAFDPLPGFEPIPFAANSGCKWPVDGLEGPGLMVCGAERSGRHYCADHHRIAYRPRTEKAA